MVSSAPPKTEALSLRRLREYASLSMCACVCLTVQVPAAWPENLATVVVASEEGMRLRARGERRLTAV